MFDPCNNNGTCINEDGSYHCNCTDGWQNKDCNDGENFVFFCYWHLFILFIGYHDQTIMSNTNIYLYNLTDFDECTVLDPCKNNGTCVNNVGSYECQCTNGWQGQDCEHGTKRLNYIYFRGSDNLIEKQLLSLSLSLSLWRINQNQCSNFLKRTFW